MYGQPACAPYYLIFASRSEACVACVPLIASLREAMKKELNRVRFWLTKHRSTDAGSAEAKKNSRNAQHQRAQAKVFSSIQN